MSKPATVRGRFITLEGGEGVGKSTQARRLAQALQARGIEVVTTREPGGTPGAEAIRELLMTGNVDRWTAEGEALLFAAARIDHVARVIEPALNLGKWVICDRYVDSTRAYQGAAGRLSDEAIMRLHAFSGAPFPDRTLLLSMPIFDASFRVAARDGPRADRFAAKEAKYFDVVSAAFDRFAAADPQRFRVVNADGSIEIVTERALASLADLL